MQASPQIPIRPRHLRRPIASYITFGMAIFSGLGLIVAGLLMIALFERVLCFCLVPLPLLVDVLIERTTWRAQKARALRRELAARGPLPLIEDTPQSYRARLARQREHDRSGDIGRAASVQDVTL